MTLKKGRALWRLPLFFIKVTSWINSKCRIYTTFKLWHKGTATRLGDKHWQCSLERVYGKYFRFVIHSSKKNTGRINSDVGLTSSLP